MLFDIIFVGDNMARTKKKVLDNKCPRCQAPIKFNPKLGLFKCEYCEGEFSAEELKDMSSEENNVLENSVEYTNYNCPDCGAVIITDENTAATFCVYCGNTSIIKSRLSNAFAPSLIIPFKHTKEEAISAFKSLKKGRPLIPKEFINEKNIEKITGIYIPFWLFDLESSGEITIDATRVNSWSHGDTHYTKTDYFKVVRDGSMNFYRVPVDGSVRFENDIMNSIEPFDYKKLVPYNHAYLSGFLAEKYDVESDDALVDAKSRTLKSAKEEMLSSAIGYASKVISSENLTSTLINKEYVLLPVYMVNVKYKDKYYIFAMNGESGNFVGNIPLDKKKAFFLGCVLFVSIFIFVLIFSYIIFLVGGNG